MKIFIGHTNNQAELGNTKQTDEKMIGRKTINRLIIKSLRVNCIIYFCFTSTNAPILIIQNRMSSLLLL